VICGKILVAWPTHFIPVVSTDFFATCGGARSIASRAGYGVVGWLVIHITIHERRLDPVWDPLRANPRFQQMLAKSDAPK